MSSPKHSSKGSEWLDAPEGAQARMEAEGPTVFAWPDEPAAAPPAQVADKAAQPVDTELESVVTERNQLQWLLGEADEMAGSYKAELERVKQQLEQAKREHCRDCCCARSWEALGDSVQGVGSIPEHIKRLRDSNSELLAALKVCAEHMKWLIAKGVVLSNGITSEQLDKTHAAIAKHEGRAQS